MAVRVIVATCTRDKLKICITEIRTKPVRKSSERADVSVSGFNYCHVTEWLLHHANVVVMSVFGAVVKSVPVVVSLL